MFTIIKLVLLRTSLQAWTKSNVNRVKPGSWHEKNFDPVFFSIVLTTSYKIKQNINFFIIVKNKIK